MLMSWYSMKSLNHYCKSTKRIAALCAMLYYGLWSLCKKWFLLDIHSTIARKLSNPAAIKRRVQITVEDTHKIQIDRFHVFQTSSTISKLNHCTVSYNGQLWLIFCRASVFQSVAEWSRARNCAVCTVFSTQSWWVHVFLFSNTFFNTG